MYVSTTRLLLQWPFLFRRYPASAVLRHCPTPCRASMVLALLSLVPPYSLSLQDPTGSPGLSPNPSIQHAIVSDPGEAVQYLPCALYCVDFRQVKNVILPVLLISRLNPFSFRLRPAVLIPLCLTFGITPAGPKFSIRWLACLAGAGITPAGIHDLARPH